HVRAERRRVQAGYPASSVRLLMSVTWVVRVLDVRRGSSDLIRILGILDTGCRERDVSKHYVPLIARRLLVLAVFAAAGSRADAQEVVGSAARIAPVHEKAVGSRDSTGPLSEQDCREYAQLIVNAFKSGDLNAVNALIDWDAIFDAATAG